MKPLVKIHIGEFYSSSAPAIITTVLGPCAAVCLYDSKNRIGGMNHILMPGDGPGDIQKNDPRYGINAMELLINQMMKNGANRYKLTAKVFGGASILSAISAEFAMGMRNIEFVVDFLMVEKIPILSYNFGGVDSRRIFYHTDTNEVLLKRIKSKESSKEFAHVKQKLDEIEKKIRSSSSVIYFD